MCHGRWFMIILRCPCHESCDFAWVQLNRNPSWGQISQATTEHARTKVGWTSTKLLGKAKVFWIPTCSWDTAKESQKIDWSQLFLFKIPAVFPRQFLQAPSSETVWMVGFASPFRTRFFDSYTSGVFFWGGSFAGGHELGERMLFCVMF